MQRRGGGGQHERGGQGDNAVIVRVQGGHRADGVVDGGVVGREEKGARAGLLRVQIEDHGRPHAGCILQRVEHQGVRIREPLHLKPRALRLQVALRGRRSRVRTETTRTTTTATRRTGGKRKKDEETAQKGMKEMNVCPG